MLFLSSWRTARALLSASAPVAAIAGALPPADLHEALVAEGCPVLEGAATEQLECLFESWEGKLDIGDRGRVFSLDGLGVHGTYGEVKPGGVVQILDFINRSVPLSAHDSFADLGSGRGRIPLQIVLTTPARAIGIELSEARYKLSVSTESRAVSVFPGLAKRLQFVHGNIMNTESWSGATVVYVASICFHVALMMDLAEAFRSVLQPGTMIFSLLSLRHCHRGLWLLDEVALQASWSKQEKSIAYVYMVAPRPPGLVSLHSLTWLSSDKHRNEFVGPELDHLSLDALRDCPKHARAHWGGVAEPSQAINRWCIHATGGNERELTWPVAKTWLLSWLDGGPLMSGWQPSALACAASERQSQLERQKDNGVNTSETESFVALLQNLSVLDEFGQTYLHLAAEQGDVEVLQHLASSRFEEVQQLVQARDDSGSTPLQAAADGKTALLLLTMRANLGEREGFDKQAFLTAGRTCSDRRVFDNLLGARADINGLGPKGLHVLHAVAFCDYNDDQGPSVLQLLIDARADPNVRNFDNVAPLHVARTPSTIELLTASRADIDAQDIVGNSALHHAVLNDRVDCTRALIACRADPNSRDSAHATPLMLAHSNATAEALLATNADLGAVDPSGESVLHHAARSSLTPVLDQLPGHAVPIDLTNSDGQTPLHIACFSDNVNIAKKILSYRADPNAKDGEEATPLMYVVHSEVAAALLEGRADLQAVDEFGATALHHATLSNHSSVVSLLCKLPGAPVNIAEKSGRTPLHFAAWNNSNLDIAKSLLDCHADVNARDESQSTPLMYIRSSHMAKLLIAERAEVGLVDSARRSALHHAARSNDTALLYQLVHANGAPLNTSDAAGDTVLDIAVAYSDARAVQAVLQAQPDLHVQVDMLSFANGFKKRLRAHLKRNLTQFEKEMSDLKHRAKTASEGQDQEAAIAAYMDAVKAADAEAQWRDSASYKAAVLEASGICKEVSINVQQQAFCVEAPMCKESKADSNDAETCGVAGHAERCGDQSKIINGFLDRMVAVAEQLHM